MSEQKVEITVRRPDGSVEIVNPKQDYLTDGLFAAMRDATRKAGRGELISYRNVAAVVEMEESDYVGRCERCGAKIDTRKAYRQREHGRLGGSVVPVIAYYCDDCRNVLHAVGAGEYTAMQERAAEMPDMTPATKED